MAEEESDAERNCVHETRVSQLVMPSAEQQRAIICSLEADGVEESVYMYTVAQKWYERWRNYVGLEQRSDDTDKDRVTKEEVTLTAACGTAQTKSSTEDDCGVTAAASKQTAGDICCRNVGKGAEDKSVSSPAFSPPGPVEMDLTDDANISVDEKVWIHSKHPKSSTSSS